MATNSKIRLRKDGKQIQFLLNGDFDGSMAMQLIGMIHDNWMKGITIVIDTTDLKQLYPFGVEVFQNRLPAAIKKPQNCRYIGSNSALFRLN